MENSGYVNFPGDYKDVRTIVQNEKKELVYTYEEAVSLTKTGKFHYYILAVIGFSVMAVINETMGISLIMPIAKCDLNMTLAQQGILASSGFLGMVITSHMWGFLADTWGRLKVLRVAVLSALILSVISALSVSVWMLIVFRFLVGFTVAGCLACAFSYLGEFHGKKTRSKVVANLSVFLPMGLVYCPALAIGILPLEINAYYFGMQFSSWRLFIMAASIPSLICGIALQFLPESPRYLLIQGDQEGALNILKKSFSMNTGKTSDHYPVKNIVLDTVGTNLSSVHTIKDGFRMIWSQTAPIFYRIRITNTLIYIFQMFLMFFVAHGIFMWTPSIVTTAVRNIDNSMSICDAIRDPILTGNNTSADTSCSSYADVFTYTIILFMGLIFSFFYMLVGILIVPVGPKRLLFIWMMTAGICGICLIWSKNFYLNVILFIGFLAIGNCGGIISGMAVDYYPSNINAMAVCFILLAGRIGAVVGSNLIATFLIDNCDTIMTSLGGIAVLSACMSYLLPTTTNKIIKTVN